MTQLGQSCQALAQSDTQRIEQLERKLERSLQVIEELKAEVEALKANSAAKSAGAQARAPEDAKARAGESPDHLASQAITTQTAPTQPEQTLGVPIHGFLDVVGGWSGRDDQKGFGIGVLDLYFTPHISDRIMALADFAFESEANGEVRFELERAQIGYTFSDALTLWAGRTLTPLGQVNRIYNHGRYLMTSITRPNFVEVEDLGGVLPVHMVGLWGTGSLPLGQGRFGYDAYVGNAPSLNGEYLEINDTGDSNQEFMTGLNLRYLPHGLLEGLTLGVQWLRTDVHGTDGIDADVYPTVLGTFLAYDNSPWELITEYYFFDNEDEESDAGKRKSWAAFVQGGYRWGLWTPYLRLEKAVFDQLDPYFALQVGGRSYSRELLGLRYDVAQRAALKFELGHTRQYDASARSYSEAKIQFAISF